MSMKRFLSFLFAMYCIWSIVPIAMAAEIPFSWYVKRGKNGAAPTVAAEAEKLLTQYNAYYVDKTIDNNDKVLYLTFDAGYENGNVSRILDILKKENVCSAFFVLSHIVEKNTTLLERMANEGHLVCNHTSKHPDLTKCSEDTIQAEIKKLENAYHESCNRTTAPFFRPPEGKYNERVLAIAQQMGYTTVFWSLAYADWSDTVAPSDEKAIALLKENTHNGAVVLLHPTSAINVRILPQMIEYWRNEGYRFGTLDELRQR